VDFESFRKNEELEHDAEEMKVLDSTNEKGIKMRKICEEFIWMDGVGFVNHNWLQTIEYTIKEK